MVGITSYGAYIPILRLERSLIAKSWGRGSLGGERSVANNDEDTLTMSVEAALDCLGDMDSKEVGGLYFASTTAPYKEKQVSTLIAKVIDLNEEIVSGDFANSLRSGTSALKASLHAVKSGLVKNMLVVSSDSRLGYPRSDEEQLFGDGAGAFLIGDTDVIAEIVDSVSLSHEMMDVWRNPEDTFVKTWEKRWVLGEGYQKAMTKAITTLMKKCGLAPDTITKAIFPAPDPRTHAGLAKGLKLTQVQDPLLSNTGDCGAAHPFMMLVSALEEAKPGDKFILAAYGNGVDAFFINVTDNITKLGKKRGIKQNLEPKLSLPSYERYLSYKGIIETVPGEPFKLFPSATSYWRDAESILSSKASKCRQCGTSTFPIQRVCYNCRSKDDYELFKLSNMRGKVFDFSLDNLAGRSDDPVIIQTVVEIDENKCRAYLMMTDCDPSKVHIGMPVELTFRRIYEGAGFHNYYWKCRPPRHEGR
ncbi:MAG: zinc ribbon domain-containing protein [Pseudomonadota bacterium]